MPPAAPSNHQNIVSTEWLSDHLHDENLIVADVRWNPKDSACAQNAFEHARIPGAVRLDLDDDLSDRSDLTLGRHPLPHPAKFVAVLTAAGIGQNSTVIAYDDASGGISARLWWMLKWIGLPTSAVLDGGIPKWRAENRPTESGPPAPTKPNPDPIPPTPDNTMVIDKPSLIAALSTIAPPDSRECHPVALLDARAAERFRGEIEPIDIHAGHIPGAISAPFSSNLTTDEIPTFCSQTDLQSVFTNLNLPQDATIVSSCGSGVTACHNALAMVHAGLPMPKIYIGSWSEWSTDPALPQATGPSPGTITESGAIDEKSPH